MDHVTYFFNFGTRSVYPDLKTTNLAFIYTTRGANEKNAKLGQSGPGRGHLTQVVKGSYFQLF